jgi:hypothetical protein
MRNSDGFGFPFGCVAVVVAGAAAGLLGAAEHHGYSLVALGTVVFGAGAVTTVKAALGTAMVAWSTYSGFTVGTSGALEFSPESGFGAAVFLCATASGAIAGAARRGRWLQPGSTSLEKRGAGLGRTAAPLRLRAPLPMARSRLRPGPGPRHTVGLRN